LPIFGRYAAKDYKRSIDTAVKNFKTYSADTLSYISQINTHSYSGSQRTTLRDLVKSKGKRLWQSESGPLSFSGDMMDSCIMLSQRTVKDLKEMQAVAWLDWQIIDGGNWGSFYVNNSAQTFTLTKKFYMHSNYSRFIRPGYAIIGADNENVLASISPDSKKLIIVATNPNKTASSSFTYNLSKFANVDSTVEVYRTSSSLDLAKSAVAVSNKSITDNLPAYSINTYVIKIGDSTSLPSPTPNNVYGDLNGDKYANAGDYTIMRRYLLGNISTMPEPNWQTTADLNLDGQINAGDYTILRRYILDIIQTLPVSN
jgi:O-glycosyl hydrolase